MEKYNSLPMPNLMVSSQRFNRDLPIGFYSAAKKIITYIRFSQNKKMVSFTIH